MDTQKLKKIITKWRLNQAFLAKKIGVPSTTFQKSLAGRKYYTLDAKKLEKLKIVLGKICDDLATLNNDIA
jgi:DNA-binding XRE family transcriptional regulator